MPLTLTINAVGAKWSGSTDRTKVAEKAVWRVRASEPTTPYAVRTHADVVAIVAVGKDYPGTTGGVLPCDNVACDPEDQTRMLWLVTGSYDSTNTFDADPLAAAAKIAATSESIEEAYFEDVDGNPARHTNDIPFTELPKRDTTIDVYTITKNVPETTTNASVKALRDKVNSDAVTLDGITYAARQLRVTSTSLSEVKTEGGTNYRERTLVVKAHPQDWDQHFESVGLLEYIDGKLQPIADPATNAPITDPWPLTEDGIAQTSRDLSGFEIVLKPYEDAAMASGLT